MSEAMTPAQAGAARRLGLILPIVLMAVGLVGIAATAIYAGHQAGLASQTLPGLAGSGQFPGQGTMPNGFPTGQGPNNAGNTVPAAGNTPDVNSSGGATDQTPATGQDQTGQDQTGQNQTGTGGNGSGNFGSGNSRPGNITTGQFPGYRLNRGAGGPVTVWEAVVFGLGGAIFGAGLAWMIVGLTDRRRPRSNPVASAAQPTPAMTTAPVTTTPVTTAPATTASAATTPTSPRPVVPPDAISPTPADPRTDSDAQGTTD